MGVAVGSVLMASGHLSIRKSSTQKTQRTQRKGGFGSEIREPLPGSVFSVSKNSEYAGAHHDERSFDFRHYVARRRAGTACELVGGPEDSHSAPARTAQGRRHRGRFSHLVAR